MKKYLLLIVAATAAMAVVSCDPKTPKAVDITVQLMYDGAVFAQPGIVVTLADAAGTASYEAETNASGAVSYTVPIGTYTASATWKTAEDGVRTVYNGSNPAVLVADATTVSFKLDLQKVESQQIIIKEFYSTGCPKTPTGTYSDDAYFILYNNSDLEADASDLVFSILTPSNAHATNKYLDESGNLSYEKADWIPANSAIWWFNSPVTIPAYSQIVVACFGAIDHTATVPASVNLSDPAYYWLSNTEISNIYKATKYNVSENIPTSHYLSCTPFGQGTAWLLSNNSPSFFVGRMSRAEAKAMSENSDAFDHTGGTGAVFNAAKFPKSKVVDCIEIYQAASVAKSHVRFSADVNTGAVVIATNQGYTAYRNVDKEATEALPENAGKIVYGYKGGTEDVEGTTDPSGIDAEASLKNGAHIIYSDTNDCSKDFHTRKVSSLKQ